MKSKLNIMKTKPEITDEEIQAFMNFDKLLAEQNAALKSEKNGRSGRYIFLGSAIIAAIVFLWFFTRSSSDVAPASNTHAQSNNDASLNQRIDTLSQEGKKETTVTDPQEPVSQKQKQKPQALPEKKEEVTKVENPPPVYVLAEPVDGYPALYEYFSRELVYPAEAVRDSVQGVVTVVFSINTEGKPEKINIENSLGPLLDREAIRVIQHMPLWKPATYNNKPVTSKMSLPLTFQIQKNQ